MKLEKISNTDKLTQILVLATEIQNKGIGHTFVDLSGHVNKVNVRIYDGGFDVNNISFSVCDCYTSDKTKLKTAIETLEAIRENGLAVLPEYTKHKEKVRARELAEFKRLQEKLGMSVELGEAA